MRAKKENNMGNSESANEGGFSDYEAQSSCHSLNSGFDSNRVSYHWYDQFDAEKDKEKPVLRFGHVFNNIETLQVTLRQYDIRHSFDLKFVNNDKSWITARCDSGNCQWRLHASTLPDGQTIAIKKLNWKNSQGLKNRIREPTQSTLSEVHCFFFFFLARDSTDLPLFIFHHLIKHTWVTSLWYCWSTWYHYSFIINKIKKKKKQW